MARAGDSWSEEELFLVRQMAKDGASAAVMSAHLPGRTRNSVIGVIRRLGIKREVLRMFVPNPAGYALRLPSTAPKQTPTRMVKSALSSFLFGEREGDPNVPSLPQDVLDEPITGPTKLITALRYRDCRAVVGPVNGGETQYCAKTIITGSSWCKEHRLKYTRREARRVKRPS